MESSEKPRPGDADDEGARDLAALRRMAMDLARRLEQSAAPAADAPADAPAEAAKLLGRNGLIECFAALARIVIRIVEVERHAPQAAAKTAAGLKAAAVPKTSATPKQSEASFGQRIAAELDRVAARRREAGFCAPADPEPPRRDRAAQLVG